MLLQKDWIESLKDKEDYLLTDLLEDIKEMCVGLDCRNHRED